MNRGPARPLTARQRFDHVCGLLTHAGFDIVPPTREPTGFVLHHPPERGSWRLRASIPGSLTAYVELFETLDTRQSRSEPRQTYEYLIHLDLGEEPGRNVSFHQDRSKPPHLLYHWHDYCDGARRSTPQPMGPVKLRWLLEAAFLLLAEPRRPVPDLLARLPPPGPGDPR